MMLLYPKNGALHFCLIQRTTYNGQHSGQISFPGGKRDATDIDLEFTARRECLEEIAFSQGWIGLNEVKLSIKNGGKSEYFEYLKKLISKAGD